MIRKLFQWIFKKELIELEKATKKCNDAFINYQIQEKRIKNLLGNIDVSVDVHHYSPSWACISIQGQKMDYIKFIELGDADLREISNFLRRFDRGKVDASPHESKYLRIGSNPFDRSFI
jgi:hypothetical protein